MPTIAQVRQGIVDTVKLYTATEMYVAADVVDMTDLPALIVDPLSANYMESGGNTMVVYFHLYVMCQRNDTVVGQGQLDGFISPTGPDSIPLAIRQHSDLGLANTDATVLAMHGYGGSFETAGISHVGAILKLRALIDP